MESPRSSMSLQEQVDYWKDQAKHYEHKANDIQQELDEYTENSAQLEKELEASLVQVEKQNRDLDYQNQRLKTEIEMLKNKLERSQHETNALESELQELKQEKDRQAVYIRELEQKNDDLERGQRVISESVSCIEAMLNQAYERNAVLESEVDEIENLRVKLQRANDEARDLKQELKVVERLPIPRKEDGSDNDNFINGHVSGAQKQETETQTSLTTPLKREINGNAMTPSSRVTAINIVGDLLRKVGLERFLCRECGNVKCSCGTPATSPSAAEFNGQNTLNDDEPIEFRKPRLSLQYDNHIPHKPPLELPRTQRTELPFTRANTGQSPLELPRPQRASEVPFTRSNSGENGKLRRSFAVRSREGLENLLGLRKGPEQKKNSVRQ